jgi:hypothetical protein
VADYYTRLANCPLPGIEWTEINRDGQQWKTRNLIRLRAAGFELELHQYPDLWKGAHDLVGKCIDTTDLYVRNIEEDATDRLRSVIALVCELLSFATESRVLPYFWEYPAASGRWSSQSMVGVIETWRRPFEEPDSVKILVDTCFNRYVDLRDRRKLHVAIDYIHHSVKQGLAAEVKIGLACIAFENLRHNWALDTGYKHIDNFFREKAATAGKPGPVVGFRRHLEEMFAEVGMKADAQRIYDTRNEVIHTGLYGQGGIPETHEFLETVLREYFLRLVGYHGPFLPYKGGSAAPIFI